MQDLPFQPQDPSQNSSSTAPASDTQDDSYVSSYVPPQMPPAPAPATKSDDQSDFGLPSMSEPLYTPPAPSPSTNDSSQSSFSTPITPVDEPSFSSALDSTSAPAPATTPAPAAVPSPATDDSLEAQNIFELLGVSSGSEQEKESFLDELQQAIWDDFMENDLKLLVIDDEMKQVQAIKDKSDKSELEKQEELVNFLEKLIPDLEDIMLEKALELKEEMVKERVAGLRELNAGQTDKLQKLDEVERLMKENKWSGVAGLLSSI